MYAVGLISQLTSNLPVVIASQDNSHNVLADIMHVSFDCCYDNSSIVTALKYEIMH